MEDNSSPDLDILAEAHLPSDLLTPSLGSNYGLDGYPDMQYGMGVLEGILDQDLQKPPALPDGVQKAGAAEMDLGGMIAEEGLADLNWLDPSQLQDPGRLPETPESIPELEQAWGVNRRTDGIHTAHQTDLAYLRATEGGTKRKANSRTIEKVVTHAMRRSIEGQHIDRIVREAAESMGEEMGRVVPLLRHVAADHGLSGNVFIRASAYPGWGTGKWKEHAKRHAKQARYLLVSKSDLKQATWIQDGRCVYTKKLAVTEVPWNRAYSYYGPRLEATGRKVASGDKKEALRKAFLCTPKQAEGDPGFLPTHQTPDQTVSMEEARERFAAYEPEVVVHDPADRRNAKLLARVKAKIASMEKSHTIPEGSFRKITSATSDPQRMASMAVALATNSKKAEYSGDNRAVDAIAEFHSSSRNLVAERFNRDVANSEAARAAHKSQTVLNLVGKVEREIERGSRGAVLRKFVATNVPREYSKEVVKALMPVFRKTGALEDKIGESKKYEGVVFKRHASDTKAKSVLAGQIPLAVNWVRRTMSEGFAGRDLDSLISNRFASSLIEAASSEIKKAREAHEGLSGFLYVDSGSYASDSGTKGCDSGALKHRANQIPNVLAMKRCATCSLVRKAEDGTLRCGTYNKVLVKAKDVSGEELATIKAANISSSNMNDAEATASLFAPKYDPSEFGLSNNNLESIDTHIPESEKVADVMFGGWEI